MALITNPRQLYVKERAGEQPQPETNNDLDKTLFFLTFAPLLLKC
jgi:hypothetical protein